MVTAYEVCLPNHIKPSPVERHVSTIAMMSMNGLFDVKIVHGSVNGEVYNDFVEQFLVPHLLPYDGHNPHSVIILDNCSIHYCKRLYR